MRIRKMALCVITDLLVKKGVQRRSKAWVHNRVVEPLYGITYQTYRSRVKGAHMEPEYLLIVVPIFEMLAREGRAELERRNLHRIPFSRGDYRRKAEEEEQTGT